MNQDELRALRILAERFAPNAVLELLDEHEELLAERSRLETEIQALRKNVRRPDPWTKSRRTGLVVTPVTIREDACRAFEFNGTVADLGVVLIEAARALEVALAACQVDPLGPPLDSPNVVAFAKDARL